MTEGLIVLYIFGAGLVVGIILTACFFIKPPADVDD